jgi:Icc-related predicted phosphoesterase
VPPAVEDLTYDVIAEYNEPGSESLLNYIDEHHPTHMYFGHVHNPKVAEVELGSTRAVNIGSHYRSTGQAWVHR